MSHRFHRRLVSLLAAVLVACCANAGAQAVGSAHVERDGCPTPPRAWEMLTGVEAHEHAQSIARFKKAGYRPISISVNTVRNGGQAHDRWSSIWIADATTEWYTNHDYTAAGLTKEMDKRRRKGFRPIAVDAYVPAALSVAPGNERYAAIWVKDPALEWYETHGKRKAVMQGILDGLPAAWRPLWVSGHEDFGDGLGPRFAAIFIKDGNTGAADLALLGDDFGEGAVRDRVEANSRLVHLSGYDDGGTRRYAATWIEGDPDCSVRWEAFRDHDHRHSVVKCVSQYPVTRVIAPDPATHTLTLTQQDMKAKHQTFVRPQLHARIARVRLKLPPAGATLAEIRRIAVTSGNFLDGDLLLLEPTHGEEFVIAEGPGFVPPFQGRIRMRPSIGWGFTNDRAVLTSGGSLSIPGQPFAMSSYHHQIVLEYDGDNDTWFEHQRNEVSFGTHWPISLDEHGVTSSDVYGTRDRDYAAVWVEADAGRVFRKTRLGPAGSGGSIASPSPVDVFDDLMEEFMRNWVVPGGALGIAVDGDLVFARGYTFEPPGTDDVTPDSVFRLGSISKVITGTAAMALVDGGMLDLETPLPQIPGVDAILNSNAWYDHEIDDVTPRMMLQHLSGMIRDPLGDYFEICDELGLAQMPILYQDWVDQLAHDWNPPGQYFRHTFASEPGTRFAYSNVGMRLMSLPIAVAAGQDYESFCINRLFDQIGADDTFMRQVPAVDRRVQFFTPNNDMHADRRVFAAGFAWPGRDPCDENDADQVLLTEAGPGIADVGNAAGAWHSSVIDFTRFLVALRDDEILSPGAKAELFALPEGRSTKVLQYTAADAGWVDRSFAARGAPQVLPIKPALSGGDALYIGRGLGTFGSIDVDLSQPGYAYVLALEYWSDGSGWTPLPIDDDGTNGLQEDGAVRFDVPADWAPTAVGPGAGEVRFWVRLTSAPPAYAPRIRRIDVGAEVEQALGFAVNWVKRSKILVGNTSGPLAAGDVVLGASSSASAVVVSITTAAQGIIVELEDLQGGPFSPGELLVSFGGFQGTALTRDRPSEVTVRHAGSYAGCSTEFYSRADGVDFIWMFNVNRGDAFYRKAHVDGGKTLSTAINDAIATISANSAWPNVNLFP